MISLSLGVPGSLSDMMSSSNVHLVADEAACCVNGGPVTSLSPATAVAVTCNDFLISTLKILPKIDELTWMV